MASVETLGALQRRLNAFITQQQVRGEVEARLRRIGRTAKVRGFRPGKIPLQILEQQYGAQVQQEALGDALQRSFADAAQANSLRVAGMPSFEIKTTDPFAEQIEYSATFEVYPEVVLGDLGAETVVRVSCTLGDEDVEKAIATMRKQRAVYKTVERAAQNDDQVRIDFDGMLGGVPFEGGQAKNFAVVLGQGRMLPDFENAIVGMKAGERKSFDMTFPADYHGKDVAGKQVTFTIALHTVEEAQLPELDAALVKSLGMADGDVDKFRAEVRSNLEREVARRVKARNKNNAMDMLLRACKMDVPTALVEGETQNLMRQAVQDMEARGIKVPQGMSLPQDMFVERAQKRVRLGLILAEVVKQHKLSARPEQVRALVEEYAQGFERPHEVVEWHYRDPSRLYEAEAMVLEDNVTEWAMAAAKVSEVSVGFDDLMGAGDA